MTEATRDIEAMAVLEQALEQPVGNRRSWIKAQSGIPADVEARAIELLDAMPRASKQISTGAASANDDDTPMPTRIGAYKVIEKLGQGGMGAVFKAERDAGDFEHSVAIKLVRPGILSPRLIERFERERQILAQLSHPGIARLYDGGTTDEGGPYIVMEFIDGVPIDEWAREKGLTLAARLQLIREVCAAVSFAHQNLIIHRDLTPTNVLVTREGEPKLIDFGIAKPQDDAGDVGGDEGTSAVSSSLSILSLTPGYAAPERYTGGAATTLSDIYSIGKLLAKLLEPYNPDADLRAIIDKASADDPDQRYPTSRELSRDLDRYLRNFPVSARPVSRGTIVSKFYERNKLPVLASLGGLAVLLGALVTAGTAYFRAEAARTAEATRVTQLRQLANYMLFDHNSKLQTVIGNSAARAELVDKAQSYLLTLEELGEQDSTLKLDIAKGFVEIARAQGVAVQPNLGELDLALDNLQRAENLLLSLENQTDPSVASVLAKLEAYRSVSVLHGKSKPDDAKASINKGFSYLDNAVGDRTSNTDWHLARAALRHAELESADLGMDDKGMADTLAAFEAEIAQWPDEVRISRMGRMYDALHSYYSAAKFSMGDDADYNRAVDDFVFAREKLNAILDDEPNDPLALYWKMWSSYYPGTIARQIGREEDAIELLETALTTVNRLMLIEPNDTDLSYFANNLQQEQAALDARLGRFEQALARQEAIVARNELAAVQGNEQSSNLSDLAYSQMVLSDIARQAGKRALACANFKASLDNIAKVEARGDVRGYIEHLQPNLQFNVNQCATGAGVDAFKGPVE